MARKEPGDYPVDENGRYGPNDSGDDDRGMGLDFETGPANEPAFRSSEYSWGKFSPTSQTEVISVEDIGGDPFRVMAGAPDTGFAGGPGGKVVHEKNAEARPA